MDDVLAMDVFHPVTQGRHVVTCFWLRHRATCLQHVYQRLPAAILQHDVDVVPILEVFEELYNIFVSQ